MNIRDRFAGCLLGLACGDAVGTTVEFKERGTFPVLTDMVGGGPFNLKKGEWTDDTSMALCIASSLVEQQTFDPRDQMQRFCRWMEEGYWSSNGACFDIGGTVQDALYRFKETGEVFSGSADPHSAGNGCLMRLAPIPMFYFPDWEAAVEYSGQSSRTTHGAQECVEASRLLAAMLHQALAGADKEGILAGHRLSGIVSKSVQAIANGNYRTRAEGDIRGTGYVIDSLEAALWCFDQTSSFAEAILKAANLGDDADTTAAICGQIAGAHYGLLGIPKDWLKSLVLKDKILALAHALEESKPDEDGVHQGFIDSNGVPNVVILWDSTKRGNRIQE
ncbi:MAG: ADP-ribosylglycohydrolase family protein [Pseudomonadota bacterium]